MADLLQTDLLSAEDAARQAEQRTGPNGIHYAALGTLQAPHTTSTAIARLIGTVPAAMAKVLDGSTYVFVPLALSGARLAGNNTVDAAYQTGDSTLVAPVATPALADKAICHRNATVHGAEYVFLSTELHSDRFALAFEFFINIAHDLVDIAGIPATFADLLADQATAKVRGETSIDAWETRIEAFGAPPDAPARTPPTEDTPPAVLDPAKARKEFFDAAFADAVAIYLLSLFLDFDYPDLREREYPLLTPAALATRLRTVHALYPPNSGYSFSILYRRRGQDSR